MTAFYNEPDPYAAAWLRNLIAAGHIAPGIVDERPIQEIEAWELAGFVQCHFFAGIGVWSHALRRAGWPDDQPIWTGSCPCQPFSAAGQRKGISDERHFWPTWFKRIDQCKPSIVVGEQVASKDGLGWLDLVSSDMEAAGYAFGASDLCAAGFGGAHIRQRLYFVGLADDESERRNRFKDPARSGGRNGVENFGATLRLADTDCRQCNGIPSGQGCECDGQASRWQQSNGSTTASGSTSGLADDDCTRSFPRDGNGATSRQGNSTPSTSSNGESRNLCDQRQIAKRWLDADWLLCRNPVGEPSWRPVESGTFPLDNAVTGRMGLLRAYGNALDAETATNFCEVVREIVDDLRPLERELDL